MAFAVAGLAFAALLAIQIVVWRYWRGRGHYLALSGLAGVILTGMTAAFFVMRLGSLFDWANAALLYGALALAYMVTYSALQGDSPTFAILRMVGAAGARGCAMNELLAEFRDWRLIGARLQDLVHGGLVRVEAPPGELYVPGPWYSLTPRGAFLARLYLAYRRLLRLEKGG